MPTLDFTASTRQVCDEPTGPRKSNLWRLNLVSIDWELEDLEIIVLIEIVSESVYINFRTKEMQRDWNLNTRENTQPKHKPCKTL